MRLWQKIETAEDPKWTARYHESDPNKLAFGGRVEIRMKDGSVINDELALANAHSKGARPFARENYIQKFRNLTEGLVSLREQDRFLDLVQCLPDLGASEIDEINVVLDEATLENETPDKKGIF